METGGSLFVCLLVSVFFCGADGQVGSLCRPNERFLSCGGCQRSCVDPAPVCSAVCTTGCFCSGDEVRNRTGHCVKLADCPPVSASAYLQSSEPRSTDTECPENEEYRFCEPCNKTCDNPNPICPAQCARGCFCKENLVRDRDGKCVQLQDCSNKRVKESWLPKKQIQYQLTCGNHQTFQECAPCEKTCSNLQPKCKALCNTGCFCDEGYLRAPSGQCVRKQDCPKAEESMGGALESSIEECSSDEMYLSCGWCEPSCWAPRPQCPPGVYTRGCLCRPPLLRHHSGHCVAEKHCAPQTCPDPAEEFVCRYGCEARCDGATCTIRPRRCTLGCHCKRGLLRDFHDRCVTRDKCDTKSNVTLKIVTIRPKFFKLDLSRPRQGLMRTSFFDALNPVRDPFTLDFLTAKSTPVEADKSSVQANHYSEVNRDQIELNISLASNDSKANKDLIILNDPLNSVARTSKLETISEPTAGKISLNKEIMENEDVIKLKSTLNYNETLTPNIETFKDDLVSKVAKYIADIEAFKKAISQLSAKVHEDVAKKNVSAIMENVNVNTKKDHSKQVNNKTKDLNEESVK